MTVIQTCPYQIRKQWHESVLWLWKVLKNDTVLPVDGIRWEDWYNMSRVGRQWAPINVLAFSFEDLRTLNIMEL